MITSQAQIDPHVQVALLQYHTECGQRGEPQQIEHGLDDTDVGIGTRGRTVGRCPYPQCYRDEPLCEDAVE